MIRRFGLQKFHMNTSMDTYYYIDDLVLDTFWLNFIIKINTFFFNIMKYRLVFFSVYQHYETYMYILTYSFAYPALYLIIVYKLSRVRVE